MKTSFDLWVIENLLPETDTKGEFVLDESGKRIQHFHWYSGMGIVPGTGVVKDGKHVPPVAGALWSPYFTDAAVFTTETKAWDEIDKTVGRESGAYAIKESKSHFMKSWTEPKSQE